MNTLEQREVYRAAPIVEAVIDIQCVNRPDLGWRDLAKVGEAICPGAERKEIIEVTTTVSPDGLEETIRKQIGLIFHRPPEQEVVQVREVGFSYSRTAPYRRWEEFCESARRSWNLYSQESTPVSITRLGIRYINSLPIGNPDILDLEPFVFVRPQTPWNLSAPPAGFHLQIRRQMGPQTTLILNEATVQQPDGGRTALLLDIDVFWEGVEPFGSAAQQDWLWNRIGELRVIEREAFEASITDRMREMMR